VCSSDLLNLLISIKILSTVVRELLKFLIGNFTILYRLKEAKSDSRRSTLGVDSRKLTLKSPHRTRFVDILYSLTKIISS
jgi:hypothetical protein